MLRNSLKIFYFIIIVLFLYFVVLTYFSEKNILKIQKININKKTKYETKKDSGLLLLENDTNNIIIYNSEQIIEKKVKKRKVWELLK